MAQTNGEADSILPVNHRHHEASEPSGSGKDAKPDTAHSRQFTSKPTISDCQQEDEQKGSLGGSIARECGEVDEVLDSLVRTILSQHTSQANSIRAKQALDKHFGTGNYQAIRIATVPSISSILQNARVGLAVKKSNAIHELLNHIYLNLNPNLSLEFIRYLPDSEAMDVLSCVIILSAILSVHTDHFIQGRRAKTASCVMLFCLGRNFFPVDTHVFRITKALAWIPPTSTKRVPSNISTKQCLMISSIPYTSSSSNTPNIVQSVNVSTLPKITINRLFLRRLIKLGAQSQNLSHRKPPRPRLCVRCRLCFSGIDVDSLSFVPVIISKMSGRYDRIIDPPYLFQYISQSFRRGHIGHTKDLQHASLGVIWACPGAWNILSIGSWATICDTGSSDHHHRLGFQLHQRSLELSARLHGAFGAILMQAAGLVKIIDVFRQPLAVAPG
ncbi:hypothetical protein H4Q26_014139 [Puccinia striiformis f. sp. tritici PST-130]|nr:hypothetical protein H4Q26_014139 [Puccinia striiformis f. sp. tritici PST-130]